MILVTGGAGFIGGNIVNRLRGNVSITDLANRLPNNISGIAERIAPYALTRWLDGRKLEAVIHMAAITDTRASDVDELNETNVNLSLMLLDWCTENKVPFVYASSAATYGLSNDFNDDMSRLASLRPLNPYANSKHQFDLEVARRVEAKEPMPPRWAGLKFFNVYGPGEDHKGDMMSVIGKALRGPIKLFQTDAMRDFVYVSDVVDVVMWAVKKSPGGIFNVGSGMPRSFNDAIAVAGGKVSVIIPVPDELKAQYQTYTCANLFKLRGAGYSAPFLSLEDGAAAYRRAL